MLIHDFRLIVPTRHTAQQQQALEQMENITVSDPFYLNDGHDHAATVMVSTVVFTLIMILTLVAKNLLRWNTGAGWYNFDNPLHCGAVMSLAQAICTGVAVNAGLGKQKEYINSAAEENKILQVCMPICVLHVSIF